MSESESIINIESIKPILWGDDCKAWFLLDKKNMCIVHEEMPPNTTEQFHYHHESEQFFYVLSGTLGVFMNESTHFLSANQGIFVPKGIPHRIFNDSNLKVEFILFASPNPRDDRVEVE